MHSHSAHLTLSLVAAAMLLPGLSLARRQRLPAAWLLFLTPLAAGILLSLLIEIGSHAIAAVAIPLKVGQHSTSFASLALVLLGLGVGRVAGSRWAGRRGAATVGDTTSPDLALLAAVAIGVDNLGKGMALGQSGASEAAGLGAALVSGYALANAAGGLAIAGALGGTTIGWGGIGLLALLAGGPMLAGALVGGAAGAALLPLACYALAGGTLLFIAGELLRAPSRLATSLSLAALVVGVASGPALLGSGMKHVMGTGLTGPVPVAASPRTVAMRIAGGRFVPAALEIPSGAVLVVQNEDAKAYTLEGAGILRGDVPIAASATETVRPLSEPGAYTINVEEDPRMVLQVKVTGTMPAEEIDTGTVARAFGAGRQPVIFSDTHDPAYAAYSRFNLTVSGEEAREKALDELSEIARTISGDWLPAELSQYFTRSSWTRLKPSVAMVVGLGPGCYDAARFGPEVAASRPADLHPISYGAALGFDAAKTQRDVLIRVTSDSTWFNQQVCRYVWHKLAGRIAERTLDCGYANPGGRSPILGGFFDGTGNPIGAERDKAVFLPEGKEGERNGTYLAWFRIRFDQERFAGHSLAERQAIIGRVHDSGRELPGDRANSHRAKTEGDGSRSILRQGVVFDDGPEETGILFASLQASLTKQLEGILRGFMMNRAAPSPATGSDRLMDYMHFEAGGYYFVPPVEEED